MEKKEYKGGLEKVKGENEFIIFRQKFSFIFWEIFWEM